MKLRGGNALIDSLTFLAHGGIKQGDTIADLGCGATGHFVFPAAHLVGSKGKVYAVDIQKSVLAAIESRSKLEGVDNVETIWADLERSRATKLPDGSVELTLLLNLLAQVQHKEAVLQEASRIAKPGSTLIVSDWKMTASPLGPPVERRLDSRRVLELARAAGFERIEEFEAGPYHFGIVFHKRIP